MPDNAEFPDREASMLMRVVQGATRAKPLLHNAWDKLHESIPARSGWMTSAAGMDRSGWFVGMLLFKNEASAAASLSSKEADLWWMELKRHMEAPEVQDSDDVEMLIPGGHQEAGFVQFISGHTTNKAEMRVVNDAMQELIPAHRPDILGSVIGWFDNDTFLETVYFTSEAEARAAENREFPGGLAGLFGDMMQVIDTVRFIDVRDPWLTAPGPRRPAVDELDH